VKCEIKEGGGGGMKYDVNVRGLGL